MNDELKTKEYIKSMASLKLADSSRVRMREELLTYARFHTTKVGTQLVKSPFAWLFFKPVQAAFAFLFMLGAGTALYLEDNDKYNTPLATIDTPVTSEAVPAPITESESPEVVSSTELAVAPQNSINSSASDDNLVSYNDNARAIATKESTEVASDETMAITMLSQGEMDINDYRTDIVKREKTYRTLITKYEKEIGPDTTKELTTKVDSTDALLDDAEGKEAAEARLLLDKAATIIGEVESTLSLLGTTTIEAGVIIDIDFE